jgi:hypothetical protein
VLPTITEYDQGRLVTRVDGRRVVTPLFVVLIAIGSTDLLFALVGTGPNRSEPGGLHNRVGGYLN